MLSSFDATANTHIYTLSLHDALPIFTGRPRRCGWVDLPLLRYSGMINGTSWLVVTKLDVLDELAEIPVCVGFKVNGRETGEIPAEASCWDKIECIYKTMPGWRTPTQGITAMSKLPKAAREYLSFVAQESGGARIGMVSTGPGRDETMFTDEFSELMNSDVDAMSPAQRRS